jgi:geranylgeranyl reductase family protein
MSVAIDREDAGGHVDVIVVGGGPAGAAFVRTLRDEAPSARVLLIDKAHFPRDKVCGDALTHTSCPLVLEVFPELRGRLPTSSFTQRYTLRYPGGRSFSRDDQELDVIPRLELDDLLWRSAVHPGVTVLEGASVTDVVRDGDAVRGVVVERDGDRTTFTADVVVAADGSGSVIRRRTRVAPEDAPLAGVRQYIRGVPPTDDGLVFILDPDHHGYFWFFPIVGSGQWSANVGWFGFKRHGGNPLQRLEAFLHDDPTVRDYVGGGTREGRVQGFPLNLAPTRLGRIRPVNPLWGPGVVLTGDAASLIHPLTGEGIAFALHSGRSAARHLARSLDASEIGPAYQAEALEFVRQAYNVPRTTLLFRWPCSVPGEVLPLYLGLLPMLDVARRGVKRARAAARVSFAP